MALTTKTVTIKNGQSMSEAFSLGGGMLVAIVTPPAWTAANLTFMASVGEGQGWNSVYNANNTETLANAAAARAIVNLPDLNGGVQLKLRSGTSAVPVIQGADRVITLLISG